MITIVRDEHGISRCVNCHDVEDIVIDNMQKHLRDFHGWLKEEEMIEYENKKNSIQ